MRPAPALRSVQAGWFPTAFIRALVEPGGAAHGLTRDVVPDAQAGSPRPVARGSAGLCGRCGLLRAWVEAADDGGVPGDAGGGDGVELAQQAAGDGDSGLGV